MSHFDQLGDRMKRYEDVERRYLTRRTPVILRLDGRAFHTYTANFNKPFDDDILHVSVHTAKHLMHEIQGAKMAYLQSDECSIVISDYDTINTDAWFAYNVQKMVSLSAASYTLAFNTIMDAILSAGNKMTNLPPALFDARVFNIPESEINNYLIWRQSDWTRNSLQSLSRKYYSQKELDGKKQSDMHEMIHQAGDNWANLSAPWKNGTFLYFDKTEDGERQIIQNYPIFQEKEGRDLVDDIIKRFYEN